MMAWTLSSSPPTAPFWRWSSPSRVAFFGDFGYSLFVMAEAVTKEKTTKKAAPKAAKVAKEMAKEFAVIETGGKQYLVAEGDTLKIEKMSAPSTASGQGAYQVGDKVVFDQVLLVDNGQDTTIGMPTIPGAKVSAEITAIGKAKKVTVIKYKAKSNYFKKRGHRQPFFEVKISKLS